MNLEETVREHRLVGEAENVSADFAKEIATKMSQRKLCGPAAFAKHPALTLTLMDGTTGASRIQKHAATSAGPRRMTVFLKLMAKALTDIESLDQQVMQHPSVGSVVTHSPTGPPTRTQTPGQPASCRT